MELEVLRAAEGGDVLVVSGDVDIYSAAALKEAGERALSDHGGPPVTIDLSQVEFMDSTGLGSLVAIRKVAKGSTRGLVLRNPSERVLRLLEICGLIPVFDIESSVPTAVSD